MKSSLTRSTKFHYDQHFLFYWCSCYDVIRAHFVKQDILYCRDIDAMSLNEFKHIATSIALLYMGSVFEGWHENTTRISLVHEVPRERRVYLGRRIPISKAFRVKRSEETRMNRSASWLLHVPPN